MDQERKNSDARIRANKKYTEKTYDKVTLYLKKGRKELIAARAESMGKKPNGYISDLIDADLGCDKT